MKLAVAVAGHAPAESYEVRTPSGRVLAERSTLSAAREYAQALVLSEDAAVRAMASRGLQVVRARDGAVMSVNQGVREDLQRLMQRVERHNAALGCARAGAKPNTSWSRRCEGSAAGRHVWALLPTGFARCRLCRNLGRPNYNGARWRIEFVHCHLCKVAAATTVLALKGHCDSCAAALDCPRRAG